MVKGLQEQFPLYANNFPVWSEHSTAIAQFAVWTALAEANVGASLQHYNPVVDEAAAKEWSIPASWVLRAQPPVAHSYWGFFLRSSFPNAWPDQCRVLVAHRQPLILMHWQPLRHSQGDNDDTSEYDDT